VIVAAAGAATAATFFLAGAFLGADLAAAGFFAAGFAADFFAIGLEAAFFLEPFLAEGFLDEDVALEAAFLAAFFAGAFFAFFFAMMNSDGVIGTAVTEGTTRPLEVIIVSAFGQVEFETSANQCTLANESPPRSTDVSPANFAAMEASSRSERLGTFVA